MLKKRKSHSRDSDEKINLGKQFLSIEEGISKYSDDSSTQKAKDTLGYQYQLNDIVIAELEKEKLKLEYEVSKDKERQQAFQQLDEFWETIKGMAS